MAFILKGHLEEVDPVSLISLPSPAVCSATLFRPQWITSYGVTEAAPWPLTLATYPCWPGCWPLCPRCWWWWSTRWWSCTRYGMRRDTRGGKNQCGFSEWFCAHSQSEFMSLVWSKALILSPLSVSGCEFATRRDRSCSLKPSWGWILHSDAFSVR